MDVLYFAWVRERVGLPREVIDANLNTVMVLVELLRERVERYVLAFADLSVLRVALDQKISDFNAPLTDVREVAFFPPMTGG
jgi:molybdopterin synthase sulfur carrier subunit